MRLFKIELSWLKLLSEKNHLLIFFSTEVITKERQCDHLFTFQGFFFLALETAFFVANIKIILRNVLSAVKILPFFVLKFCMLILE